MQADILEKLHHHYSACQSYLFRSAKSRGIKLNKEQEKLITSELARSPFFGKNNSDVKNQ
jgi:hypothetical protein